MTWGQGDVEVCIKCLAYWLEGRLFERCRKCDVDKVALGLEVGKGMLWVLRYSGVW